MTKVGGAGVVRAMIADAQPVGGVRVFQGDPEPGEALNGVEPGQWVAKPGELPPGCPVVPLGVDGAANWFLDPIGQLYCYQKPYGQADTLELFRGRHHWLYWAWPKRRASKDGSVGDVEGWKNEYAREALIAACTARGPWNATDKVRGRGCWPTGAGLAIHCGPTMIVGGREEPCGVIDGYVYPTRPPVPEPWPRPAAEVQNPAEILRPLFSMWNWARPVIDPHLLLGWIGVAFLGAALPWRSAVFLTGDKGSGKSTLQEIVKAVLGDWLVQTTNTTAAGIYQRVGQDCLPVAVDEFEGKADNGTAKKLLELARQSSSGGLMLRGGDRHQGVEFQARSAFLFSSINAPPMEPQDLSRFALLRLHRLPQGQPPPQVSQDVLAVCGRVILRRLIEQWQRYSETLAAFKAELGRAGMDGRGQDTFGTLLAVADMIEHDGWNDERLRHATDDGDLVPWSDLMATHRLAEFEDAAENWRACLDHLLSVPVEAWRNGSRHTVGQVLEAWHDETDFDKDITKPRALLGQAGLGLVRRLHKGDWLAVPNQSPLVRKLFEGSKWGGEIGAGVWAGALRQSPRGEVHDVALVKVNGVATRATLVSLDALYDRSRGIMQQRDAGLVAEGSLQPMAAE